MTGLSAPACRPLVTNSIAALRPVSSPLVSQMLCALKQQLLDAGAPHVIATEETDLVGEVMRITNGLGARVALDPVGGPTFPQLISALSLGGIIYICGLLSTGVTPLPVLGMIAKVPTIPSAEQ